MVARLPDCDYCSSRGLARLARYDIRTPFGAWVNVCEQHYESMGTGLGLGLGQELILKE